MAATRGRPPKLRDPEQLRVQVDGPDIDRLDAWVMEIRAGGLGVERVSRSDLLRSIVKRALDDHDRGRAKKKR